MKDVNQITICKSGYESIKEFKNAVKKVIMALLDNGYIMTVKYDLNDKKLGIVVIDYSYSDESFGGYYPHWLSPEEFESIEIERVV